MKGKVYSYIIADLIKRNSSLLIKEMKKKGETPPWTMDVLKICNLETRDSGLSNDIKRKLKANNGLIWNWMRQQYIDTRHIYLLLTCWALTLSNEDLLELSTSEFEDLLVELKTTTEAGVCGETDHEVGVIEGAYEHMRINYLPILHGMCERKIEEWI